MIGYRKLALAAGTVVLATLLTLLGHLTGEQWASTVTWLVGLYIGGNVAAPAVSGLTVKRKESA